MLSVNVAKAQDETICMPTKVAKLIAIDLTNCDSLREMYNLTIEEITLMEEQSKYKDSALNSAKVDITNLTKQVANEHDQKLNYVIWYNRLKEDNDKLIIKNRHRKTRRTILDILLMLAGGALGYFYYIK